MKIVLKQLFGVSLLLIVFTNCIWANNEGSITFAELRLGDWFILNQTTPPDNINNEFSTTWRGSVVNRTEQELTIEFTLTDLFALRSSRSSSGGEFTHKYYIDSNFPYIEDREKPSDLISNPPKITMTRSLTSSWPPNVGIQLSDSSRNYSLTGYSQGVDNRDSESLSFWIDTKLNIDNFTWPLNRYLLQDELISTEDWELKSASFNLSPNTTIYYKLNGYVEAWIPKIYRDDDESSVTYLNRDDNDTFSTSLHLSEPTKMNFYGCELWLTPGDSLTISLEEGGLFFTGRGAKICEIATEISAHTRNIYNNLIYAYYDVNKIADEIEKIESIYSEKLYPNRDKIDPYWYKSAELSLSYIESTVAFGNFSIPNLVESWDSSFFDSICPMLDYRYQPEFYNNFLRAFYRNQCALLNSNNLTNKGYWSEDIGAFYLIKQLFSGYMQSYLWLNNIEDRLDTEPISDLKENISTIRAHCFNSNLNDKLNRLEAHYTKLNNGSNIKELDYSFIKYLPIKNNSDDYTLFNISIFPRDTRIFSNIDSLLIEANIEKQVQWVNIRGEYVKDRLTQEQVKEVEKYGYVWLTSDGAMDAFEDMGLSSSILLVLRSDGTIIGRVDSDKHGAERVIDIILKDKEEVATAPLLSNRQLYMTITIFIILTTTLALYYSNRTRKHKLQIELSQLRLRAIRSQMNPHFIFNALTSIQSLILRSDTVRANHYLTQFSRMLRNVLISSDKVLIPLSSELELIDQYLQIEQLRMPISYKLNIDSNISIDDIEIPGLLLQPIVENAVIHGLFPQEGGDINISLSIDSDNISCIIMDNGVGLRINSASKATFGLKSTQERLTLLNHSKASQVKLKVINRADQEEISGCIVEIIVPL